MKNPIFLATFLAFFLFYKPVNAQNELTVSEALKDLGKAEIIQFDSKTRREKKLFKKWKSFPQISKVIITESYDTLKVEQLLNEIAKNENIEEVFISVNEGNQLPLSLSKLSNISTLKIYNSPKLNQQKLSPVLSELNQLTSFSWINNKALLEVDFSEILPNLKNIELIDDELNNVLDSKTNISKLKNLENVTISIKSIDEMVLLVNEIKLLSKINLIDKGKYKSEESVPNYLEIENDLSVKFWIVTDKTILLEYYGNSSVMPEKVQVELQKKFRAKKIIEWSESSYSTTLKPIEPLIPSVIIENDTSSNFEHENQAKVQPIKTLILPKTIYKIDNSAVTQITRDNGTTIEIPPNAFVNKNGDEVKGDITITYKEYMDPLSIFASGIPMTYDSGGVINTFTSAGMFEIYAFNGTEELQLKPGKGIDVQFASINDSSNYNFYQFDETKKEWKYESSELNKVKIDSSNQTTNFSNILGSNQTKRLLYTDKTGSFNFDTTCFESRFNNLDYFNLFDSLKKNGKVRYSRYYDVVNGKTKYCSIPYYSRRSTSNMFKITRVPKPDMDSIKHVLFTLENEKMLVWFPELRIFYGYVFYTEDFKKYKHFKEQYFKDIVYSDVRIEYDKGDDYCTFVLKSSTGFVSIKANILDINKTKKSPYVYKSFDRRYRYYKKRLAIRQKAFDMMIENKKVDFLRRQRQRRNRGKEFNKDSICLGLVSWAKPVSAKRRAELVKTGLYNCDVQYEPVVASVVDLNLKDSNSQSIQFDKIYLFDKDMNGYMTYETKKVVLQPETTLGIIASTAAGVLYYITKTGLQNKDFGKKEVDIEMNKSTDEIKSISDLVRLFR